MSQAPVTWQAPASLPHPRPHPPCRRRGPTRRPPPRTPRHWQASPSRPSLLPPSNGRGAGQAEQAAAAQPGLRPVSRFPSRAPAAFKCHPRPTRRGPRHLFPRATVAAPRGRKQLRLCSSVPAAAATSDLRARAASPASPRPPSPRPRWPGRRRAPGRARARTRACVRAPASLGPAPPPGAGPPRDPRPRAASHVPRRPAASRAPRRAAREDGGVGGRQRCSGGECRRGAPFPRPARPRRWLPPGGGPAPRPRRETAPQYLVRGSRLCATGVGGGLEGCPAGGPLAEWRC